MPIVVFIEERNDRTGIYEKSHFSFPVLPSFAERDSVVDCGFLRARDEAFFPAWTTCFGSPPMRSKMVVSGLGLSIFFRDIVIE